MEKNILIIFIIITFMFLIYNIKSKFEPDLTNLKFEPSYVTNFYNKYKLRFVKNSNKNNLGIDMVYAITMPQRKEYITKQINKLNLTCKYFDAIQPSDLTTDEYNQLSNINNPKSDIFEKYTRLPVLLSFIMCFMDAIENKYETIVLFEDDIQINVNNTTLNESIQEFLNSDCDIFYMGYCYMNCKQLVNVHKYKNLVEVEDRNILCCHALCIKTEILPGLINFCFPMINNSDELFRNYFMLNNIKVCVPRQAYFRQNRDAIESLNESYDDELKTCKFKI